MGGQASTALSNSGAQATPAQINNQPPNSYPGQAGPQAGGTLPAGSPTQGAGVEVSASLPGSLIVKVGIAVLAVVVIVAVVNAIKK